jgi:lipopolysaccharide export system permease protein
MAATDAFADAPAPRPRRWGLKPTRLSLYVLGQVLGPVAMLTLLLASVVWLVQILPLLDLVINRGQSAFTFLYLALLLLPTLMIIIVPLAFFFGALAALQRLSGDSELVVMASAGYSLRQIALPVLGAAAAAMALTYLCSLYLAPAGQRTLNAKKVDINADVGAALLNEGQFNPVARGITVFIKQINADGTFKDILVHDGREVERPSTYIAASGQIVQTQAGARLLMFDGTLQSGRSGKLSTLKFERYVVGLDQFASQVRDNTRRASDRFLDELLWPADGPVLSERIRRGFTVEAHNRLSQPLYCIAFGLIALAAVVRGRRQRGPLAMRLIIASLCAIILRIAGYGVAGAAQNQLLFLPLFYLIPLGGALLAILVLAGYSPAAILARRKMVAA